MNHKKTQTKIKINTTRGYSETPLRHLPESLEELTENLVDESVPEHRDAPASSFGMSFAAARKSGFGQAQFKNSLPEGPNCDICLRTKIIRAPCS